MVVTSSQAAERPDLPATRVRAPQDRSIRVRARILDAAIDILSEHGYAGATTTRVQETAGVSRGRLLHHFRSRGELLMAAVHRLFDTRMEALQESVPTLVSRSSEVDLGARVDAVIEAMWSTHQRSYFWASTQLWLAARQDETLRLQLLEQERALGRLAYQTIASLFGPELSTHPRFRGLVEILVSSMRGLRLSYALTDPQREKEPAMDDWKTMARLMLEV